MGTLRAETQLCLTPVFPRFPSIIPGGDADEGATLLFWMLDVIVHVYQLNEDGPGDEMDGEDEIATYREWTLPSRDFHGLWESLALTPTSSVDSRDTPAMLSSSRARREP